MCEEERELEEIKKNDKKSWADWGESMIKACCSWLARKTRLRCDKRMPKMDTDLLLEDADVKQIETTLTQQLTVAEFITTTNGSMTGDEQWSKLKGALTTAAQAVVSKSPKELSLGTTTFPRG